jgi:uncharacterized damage-inducible protein DinB
MMTQGIVEALDRAPSIVVPLVRQASPAILRRRPPSGKWSIHEHACHLAYVHALFVQRLDIMLAQDNLLREELDEALERFTADRTRLVERLRRLTPAEWARPARHDEYNSYSVFTMFRHLALHDFFHAYRIEELVLRRDWPAPTVSWE